MWEALLAVILLLVAVATTVVAVIVLEELSDLPEILRASVRGHTARRSLSVRVAELEARLTAAERQLGQPRAPGSARAS